MAVTFNIRPMVEKNSVLPMERLRVLSNFEELRLGEMRRGVVFVFAAWSGVAILALRRFTRVMAELDSNLLDLVVLDIDCLTTETATELFGNAGFQAGGYGETIWVRDGTVVAREFGAPDANEPLLRRHTHELLDEKTG